MELDKKLIGHTFKPFTATVEAGKIKLLAVSSLERSSSMPNVPTMTEAGVKDMEAYAFQGLLGPAGMPKDVVAKLNAALRIAVASVIVSNG